MTHPAENSWRVLGASVCGAGHRRLGRHCQDRHDWRQLPGGVLAVAVADGAGSAALAAVGARTAVRAALAAVEGRLSRATPADGPAWRALLLDVLASARDRVFEEAAARGRRAARLATTLLVVVASPGAVAAGQVGDGAVVAVTEGAAVEAVTRPAYDDCLNRTTFLTCPDALASAQLTLRAGRVAGVALLSDGLQMLALKMPEGRPHEPFFGPLLHFAGAVRDREAGERRLRDFLRSPGVTGRTQDDVTLVLAVPAAAR